MKKWLTIAAVLGLLLSSMVIYGCAPNRVSMADVVKWYGISADTGLVVEWTGITPSDDKELLQISQELSSIAKGVLVYIPSYGIMGTVMNPKSLWQNMLIVVDTPSGVSDEEFANKISSFLKKWFDISSDVSTESRVKLTVMGGDLYVYTIGNLKVLSGKPNLEKRQKPEVNIERFLENMLSLSGDYRIGMFSKDVYGIFSFKGGSAELVGKLKLLRAPKVFLKSRYLPQYAPVPQKDAAVFFTVTGDVLDAFYNTLRQVAGGFLKDVFIPKDMQMSVIVPSYTDDKMSVFTIGGISVDTFTKMLKSLGAIDDNAVPKVKKSGDVSVYVAEGIQFAEKNGIIYVSPDGDMINTYIDKLFIPQHRQYADTYQKLIDRNNDVLVAFVGVPTKSLPSDIKMDIPRRVSIVAYGSDVLSVKLTMDKPLNLKDEIYKLIANFKNITVDAGMKRKIMDAKSTLISIGFSVADYQFKNGRYPQDKKELVGALNDYQKRQKWLDGRQLSDVILDVETKYIVDNNKAKLCIPVPSDYVKYTHGRYAIVNFSGFVEFISPSEPTSSSSMSSKLTNPEDYVSFGDVCK